MINNFLFNQLTKEPIEKFFWDRMNQQLFQYRLFQELFSKFDLSYLQIHKYLLGKMLIEDHDIDFKTLLLLCDRKGIAINYDVLKSSYESLKNNKK